MNIYATLNNNPQIKPYFLYTYPDLSKIAELLGNKIVLDYQYRKYTKKQLIDMIIDKLKE